MDKLLRLISFFSLVLFSSSLVAQEAEAVSLPGTQLIDISDTQSGRNYKLYIKVPPAYYRDENKEKTFPVIYMTDASYNFPVVEGFMRVASFQGAIQPSIIVGISWEVESSSSVSRAFDYTPTVDAEWQNKTGGANSHLRFIKEEVFNYIENEFRTDSNKRLYIGYSLGGLLGAYALLTDPDMFTDYILVSPSLWFDEKYILRKENSGDFTKPDSQTKVYISVGEFETPEYANIRNNLVVDAELFHNRILEWNSSHVQSRFHIVDEAVHDVAFPEPVAKALYWMLKGVP